MKKALVSIFIVALILMQSFGVVSAASIVSVSDYGETKIGSTEYSSASENLVVYGTNQISYNKTMWTEYEVNIKKAGEYQVSVYLGYPGSSKRSISISVDGENTVKGEVTGTGAYNSYKRNILASVYLSKGNHTVRFINDDVSGYFSYVSFERIIPEGEEVNFSKKIGTYKMAYLPAKIEAENFNLTGNVSLDKVNSGGAYRLDVGIDIYEETSGRRYISTKKGESVKYTFNVEQNGIYALLYSGNIPEGELFFDSMPYPILIEELSESETGEKFIEQIFLEKGIHTIIFVPKSVSTVDYFKFTTALKTKDYITMQHLLSPQKPSFDDETEEVHPIYKELYVDANGSDSNSGTKDKPFKTIKRAKEEVKKLNNSMTGDIIINLASCTYEISETEVFTEEVSGKNGFDVVFRGDKSNKPVISGGKEITKWEKVNDYIWSAPFEAGKNGVYNLYINDNAAIKSQSKYKYLYLEDYDDPKTSNKSDGIIVSAENFPEKLSKPENIELCWPLSWKLMISPVKDIKRENDKVIFVMDRPFWDYVEKKFGTLQTIGKGKMFYIQNAFELLDEPGEFYYNESEKRIYYYPFAEEDMSSVKAVVAQTELLIDVRGNSTTEKVENLKFEGLSFKYGTDFLVKQNGLVMAQADAGSFSKSDNSGEFETMQYPRGQFTVNNAKNLSIRDCEFSCLGSTAIIMQRYVENSKIIGNVIRETSGAAIDIGAFDLSYPGNLSCTNNNILIKNNVIRHVSTEYKGCPGVIIHTDRNIKFTNNDIQYTPYSGISVGWGWETYTHPDCRNIDVTNNRISDIMMELEDGGGIYTLGKLYDSEIKGNYILRQHCPGYSGIYLDAGSSYLEVSENLILESPKFGFIQAGYNAVGNRWYNNYSNSDIITHSGDSLGDNDVEKVNVVSTENLSKEAQAIIDNSGVTEEYRYLLDGLEPPEYRMEMWLRPYARKVTFAPKYTEGSGNMLEWIQAEDFMEGGQNVGYYKAEEVPNNNPYRPDGVVLQSISFASGYVIGVNFDGEWCKYEFEVPETGEYDLYFKANFLTSEGKPKKINMWVDDEKILDSHEIYGTDLTESYFMKTVHLEKGQHIAKVELCGYYFDAFRFVPKGTDIKSFRGNHPSFDEGVITK